MAQVERMSPQLPVEFQTVSFERPEVEELKAIIQALPEEPVDISPELANMSEKELDALVKAHTEDSTPAAAHRGAYHYDTVLRELDRLKERLGGSPVFGNYPPTLDTADHNKTFFGVPIAAVKDWFKMVLERKWVPVFFWRLMARLFNVSEKTKMSRYEEAHTRIQRFGLMIEHKDHLVEIVRSKDQKRYSEMSRIAGLAWHPKDNPGSTEEVYINMIDQFFTEQFNQAKSQGDNALVEFFNAIDGVCFEDRARHIEQYILKHPTEECADIAKTAQEVQDWDTGSSVQNAFSTELTAAGISLQRFPTPAELREVLEKKGIFNLEFKEDSGKQKPSLETYHEFALVSAQQMCLDYYSLKDFLNTELEILFASGRPSTRENFTAQLQVRMDKLGSIEVYDEKSDVVEFNVASAFDSSSLASTLVSSKETTPKEKPIQPSTLKLTEDLIQKGLADLAPVSQRKWKRLSEEVKNEILQTAQAALAAMLDDKGEIPAHNFVATRKSAKMSADMRMQRAFAQVIGCQLQEIKRK